MSTLALRKLPNHFAKAVLDGALALSNKKHQKTFFFVVEHAGYGAMLSRLMTGLNRSLKLDADYSFRVDSPYIIESLFEIPFKKLLENQKNSSNIINWDFFKETWDAPPKIRADQQFPRCPLAIDGPPLSRHQWCAILAKAICGKPSFELQNTIDSTKTALGWSGFDLIVGLHVRRGDKNTEVPYILTETYIHFVDQICALYPSQKIAIFLASDDPDSYIEFKSKLTNVEILWDLNEERFNNYNAAMVKESADMAKQESITAAKNIVLLGECDYVIGMASAQFTWIGGLLSVFKNKLDTSRHIMIDAASNLQSHWACTYGFKAADLIPNLKAPESIKVLHISPDENGGGAAKAAYRLHCALRQQHVHSRMLVLRKDTDDASVFKVRDSLLGKFQNFFYKKINKAKNKIDPLFNTSNPSPHSLGKSSFDLVEQINKTDADIIHLHWIVGMLSIDDIGRIKKPIVWTMHDMWPICGAEHYVPDDLPHSRFRSGYLETNRPSYESGPDLNKASWEAKLNTWKNKPFSMVGCSQWLANCAKESPLFKQSQIYAINHCLDLTTIWKPYPKESSRAIFHLPKNKKLILAGAVGGISNFYKGGDLLLKTLVQMKEMGMQDIEIILFGQDKAAQFHDWPFPVHDAGEISDPTLLAKLYSCADLVIMPSRQEAFGQIAAEAQACSIPVAAFNIGGPIDIVEHQKTGWLAPAYDTKDLAHGIRWILGNPLYDEMSKTSRTRALALFSETVIADQYIDIYKQTLCSQI